MTADTEIDHDVEVVGWGVDQATGLKFWHVRNSWGSYWGELGFFRVERGAGGAGALQIESGDCWYAIPEHGIEDAVANGTFTGSMDGLKKKKKKDKEDDGVVGGGGASGGSLLKQAWGDWPAAEPLARGFDNGWAAAAAGVVRRAFGIEVGGTDGRLVRVT